MVVRKRDIRDVVITRAMRGAECWTDHRLIRSTLNLITPPLHRKRPKLPRKVFSVTKLQQRQYLESFQYKLDEELAAIKLPSVIPTEKWTQFREAVTESAKTVLRLKTRNHQDWFDENDSAIDDLLAEKNKAYMEWQNYPGSTLKKGRFKSYQTLVQREIRKMHDKWWEKKAEEVQGFPDSNNFKHFLTLLRRCLVLQNLAPVRCSLQTEPCSSVSYLTVHPLWTLLYFIRSPREQ